MFSTIETKQQQIAKGFFQTGSGPTKVLLLGSCRTLCYLNYLDRWNRGHNDAMTIYRIDPCDFNWNAANEIVDCHAAINAQEKNGALMEMLSGTDVFIHEYFENYGLFNTREDAPKNIYQFGLKPRVNACLPNYHDHFVLFQEQVQFDEVLKNIMSAYPKCDTINATRDKGLAALEKFYSVCRLSDFPELETEMRDNWTNRRFFWTGNHVSRHFTLFLMRQLNNRFLHLPLGDDFWAEASKEDQFSTPCTPVTKWDVDAYGLTWENTPIEELKL